MKKEGERKEEGERRKEEKGRRKEAMNLQELEVLNFTLYLTTHAPSRPDVPSIWREKLFGFHLMVSSPVCLWV